MAGPELRSGSFFPLLLERRRRVDLALFAVVTDGCLAPHREQQLPGLFPLGGLRDVENPQAAPSTG